MACFGVLHSFDVKVSVPCFSQANPQPRKRKGNPHRQVGCRSLVQVGDGTVVWNGAHRTQALTIRQSCEYVRGQFPTPSAVITASDCGASVTMVEKNIAQNVTLEYNICRNIEVMRFTSSNAYIAVDGLYCTVHSGGSFCVIFFL